MVWASQLSGAMDFDKRCIKRDYGKFSRRRDEFNFDPKISIITKTKLLNNFFQQKVSNRSQRNIEIKQIALNTSTQTSVLCP